jgi:hypothetical protein
LVYRVGYIFSYLLGWFPDIPIKVTFGTDAIVETGYIGSGPLIGSFLVLIIIFFTGSWILENYLEV